MRTIIYICLTTSLLNGQDIAPNIFLDKICDNVINQDGTYIEFDYLFENNNYQMEQSISGSIALFSEKKFYLEFDSKNKIIQIYNGKYLSTILTEEKEIQIDTTTPNTNLFLQDVFTNYKERFTTQIINNDSEKYITIELKPIKKYIELVYNHCIDTLQLPTCLKLPLQCKIGLTKENKVALNECLENNQGYEKTEVVNIQVEINKKDQTLHAITQKNRYNGISKIIIKNIGKKDESCLTIDTLKYPDFETIDLR